MTSPATIPADYQQKLHDLEAKVEHYQGLEEKLDRLEKILEALIGGVQQGNAVISPNNAFIQKVYRRREQDNEKELQDYNQNKLFTQPPDDDPKRTQKPNSNSSQDILPSQDNLSVASAAREKASDIRRSSHHPDSPPSLPRLKEPPAPDPMHVIPHVTPSTALAVPPTDAWTTVEKRGKRNAETVNIADPKRSDVRGTPTKLKANRRRHSNLVLKPTPTKQNLIYNPYKADTHQAVRNNRPMSWQQQPTPSSQSTLEEGMDYSNHSQSPPSPARSLPAEEARPNH
jgi:hypothetical protein